MDKRGRYLATQPIHRKGQDAGEPGEKRNQGLECSQGVSFQPPSASFSGGISQMDFCHTVGGLLVGSSETHFSLVGCREKLRG